MSVSAMKQLFHLINGKILVFLLCALLTPAFMLPAAAAAVPGSQPRSKEPGVVFPGVPVG